jgi:hypothetical protein
MRFFLVLCLTIGFLPGFCQRQQSTLPVISLRAMPSSFLESDAGASLGIGLQLAKRWEAVFDPMYIFYAPYKTPDDNAGEKTKIKGSKIRTGIKYYLRDYEYAGKPKLFFAVEWHYKRVTETKWDDFGMNGANGQYAFFQRGQYDEIKTENGGIVKTGFITKLWNPRWALEVFAGIGVKYTRRRQTNMPTGGEFLNDPNFDDIFTSTAGATPMMPLGARFLFRIL